MAVVHEINRALINLVEQQIGDACQPRPVTGHGRRAVAQAEIALPIDQRLALLEILRHAHQRVGSRMVAVGMKTVQHIAHHRRALDRLGTGDAMGPAKTLAPARHAAEDGPLH